MSASSSMWETPFWKIWRAFPGPLKGLINTSSFLGRGTSQLSISLKKKPMSPLRFKFPSKSLKYSKSVLASYWYMYNNSELHILISVTATQLYSLYLISIFKSVKRTFTSDIYNLHIPGTSHFLTSAQHL